MSQGCGATEGVRPHPPAKELKVVIDRIFPFDEARDPIAYLETGRAKGKVVLTMKLAQLAPLRLGDAAVWRPGVLINSQDIAC